MTQKVYRLINASLSNGTGSTSKVKISSADDVENYLNLKIDVQDGLTKEITNPAANEVLTLGLDASQIDHTLLSNIGTNSHAEIDSALNLITDVNWTGDYDNGTTYAVGDGVMYNGASFRMIAFIGAAGYAPPAYPGNWLQVTDYVSPNDIGLGNVDNTSDLDKPISDDTQDALDLKQDSLGFTPENVANKSTNTNLGTSDTLYPSQNAVKTYVDNAVTGGATPDATTLIKGKVKLAGDLSGTADLPTVPGLATKEPTITATTSADYYRGDKTFQTLNKAAVGLSNVDDTNDLDKPISNDTQDALDLKVAKAGDTMTGNLNILPVVDESESTLSHTSVLFTQKDAGNILADSNYTANGFVVTIYDPITSDVLTVATLADGKLELQDGNGDAILPVEEYDVAVKKYVDDEVATKENAITAGTTSQYWRGDKTFQTLDKSAVGLANVDNTSDADKPISSATQTALNGKANSSHVHALSDLTQSAATNGQVPSWNGTNWVPSTPSTVITDHTLLTNIGTNTHANIDTHIAATSAVHGVTGSVVGTSDSQALTNKTFDADLNTVSNIDNADIKAAAAIDRTKLASGTANRIVINDGTGVMADAAAITASRALVSDASGIPTASAVTSTELGYVSGVTSAIQTQINGKQNSLGFTPEDVANKSTTTTLGTSDTLYPTQNAVKTYVDNAVTSGATPDATTLVKGKVKLAGDLAGTADLPTVPGLAGKEPTITATTSADYYRGDKTFQTLDKTAVGLANVDNTSDANKPISTATQTALNGKADTAHVHALSDLTQSSATSGQVPSWNGTNWVPVTPSTGVTDHTLLTNIGTNTHAQIDAFMATTSNVYLETKEPTGFFSRTTTTLSFDNGTRNFSITPTGATFDFWVKGVKYTKTGAQTIQIPALSGNHFIYYDSTGALGTTQAAGPELFIDNALISIIYWNTDTNTRTYFAEERHGMQMDGATHSYLHTVFGAQFISGLALQGFSVNGNGSLDAHAQFTSDSGTIRDEDIVVTISAQTQIPVLYRQGLLWRKKAADAFPFIYSGTAGYTGAAGRIPFNEFTGGAWQLTEIANNAFVLVHLFGTNDIENPVVAIQGIATYGNVTAARLAASSEITSLSGLPFAEFVALGSVVLESSNSYSNTPQSIVRSVNGGDYVDFRGTQLYTPAGEVTTHGLLSGLSSDDHLQYHTDSRADTWFAGKTTDDLDQGTNNLYLDIPDLATPSGLDAANDDLVIYSSIDTAHRKIKLNQLTSVVGSAGDIAETSASFLNNISTPTNVVGLAFATAVVSSFEAQVVVSRGTKKEVFTLLGVQIDGDFSMSVESVGVDTGIDFTITALGQVQYTSTNAIDGGTIKFRAITLTV